MERTFITTADGSLTIHLPEWDEHYHSKHGAIQEALHVFIAMGLKPFVSKPYQNPLSILEIGFGTGLNALLSLEFAKEYDLQIAYTGIEAYPLPETLIKQLNYTQQIGIDSKEFLQLHASAWEQASNIHPNFELTKMERRFEEIDFTNRFDLIYFDAFGARVQPELWTEPIFNKMIHALKPKGVLVTYAAKGSVRRAMQTVGFEVERLPGPPGKREMLRATKPA